MNNNELNFEFADESNATKLRICKNPTSNYELDEEKKNYIESTLKFERRIDVDFEDKGNYAFYNLDDPNSETFFILKNKNENDPAKAYISIGLRHQDYEIVCNEVSFEKAQIHTASYIQIQNGINVDFIIHDVEKWQDYVKKIEKTPTFENDREKMEDFFHISKEEFLSSYDYLSEEEYDATKLKLQENKMVLEEIEHKKGNLTLGKLFNSLQKKDEKEAGWNRVTLSGGNYIEASGDDFYDLKNGASKNGLAFNDALVKKIAEVNGISYFKNIDDRMDYTREIFSLNDDEISHSFANPEVMYSKEWTGKNVGHTKEAFISREAAKTITFDEEITYEDGVVNFYAWATDELMENFVPSEKRLGLADEDNNIKFFFSYKDDANITMELSYYKGDEQIYETYRIAPESEGYDLLKFAMDAYCMELNGQHLEDYNALDGKTPFDYMELSTIINSKAYLEKVRDSLEESENKEELDMLYSPLTKEKLIDFINIAQLDSFNDEMADECLKVYEGDNIPLVIDELGNIYQREMSKDLRSNTENDLIELNPSGLIDYYKNQLEVESETRDEQWNIEHKATIDALNDIEDYLVKIENSFQLTTENAEILADYINQHKEEFGKGFTKTNGHIPYFEDMSKELAQDILETLETGDYFVRYDEGEKQFFIYDHQAADNSLFEEVDASTIVFKADRIADEWSRDDLTEHENEICKHLEKYLYPEESFLPVNLKIDLRIPSSLKEKWENKGHSEEELLSEIEKAMQKTMLTETVVKSSGLINAEEASVILQTSIVVKEPYFNEKLQTKEYQKEIEAVLSKRFGIAIENRFVKEFRNDYKLSDRVMFKNIAAEDITQTKERSLEELKENDKVNDISVKVENIPEWAVGYMAYGDSTGLSDKEISQIDNWMKENKLSNLSEVSDERHFASHPEFGLACDCVEGTFIKIKEQKIQKVQSAESKSVSTPKEIIDSYINKVKENLSEDDKKIVEKVLLASKTALSSFNADEKSVIGKYFLDSGVTSEDKLGKLLSKEVTKQEKQQKKDNTRKIEEGRGY